jgi:hypothetical protein
MSGDVDRVDFESIEEAYGENPYDHLSKGFQHAKARISVIDDLGYLNATLAVERKAFDGRHEVTAAIAQRRDELQSGGGED